MKLSKWAKKQGISYNTAWRWVKKDKMPVRWHQTATGTIIVEETAVIAPVALETYCYARVSSAKQREDLGRQMIRVSDFCAARGWAVAVELKEVASGMNDNRPQLNRLFEMKPGRLVVENKDRLTRFGFNYIEVLLTKLGWEVVVINEAKTNEDELMKDLVSVITSFCCRLYGQRRGSTKIKQIKEVIDAE
jgi:predicted site-specific integrase-resolvase